VFARGSRSLTAAARRAVGQGVGRWERPTPGRRARTPVCSHGSGDGGQLGLTIVPLRSGVCVTPGYALAAKGEGDGHVTGPSGPSRTWVTSQPTAHFRRSGRFPATGWGTAQASFSSPQVGRCTGESVRNLTFTPSVASDRYPSQDRPRASLTNSGTRQRRGRGDRPPRPRNRANSSGVRPAPARSRALPAPDLPAPQRGGRRPSSSANHRQTPHRPREPQQPPTLLDSRRPTAPTRYPATNPSPRPTDRPGEP
jgi:hypothetical protein